MLYLQSEQQKENFIKTLQDIQEGLEKDPEFLSNIITCHGKTWVCKYSQETQQQSSQVKSPSSSPHLKRARRI
jgi:hypothetical protein